MALDVVSNAVVVAGRFSTKIIVVYFSKVSKKHICFEFCVDCGRQISVTEGQQCFFL